MTTPLSFISQSLQQQELIFSSTQTAAGEKGTSAIKEMLDSTTEKMMVVSKEISTVGLIVAKTQKAAKHSDNPTLIAKNIASFGIFTDKSKYTTFIANMQKIAGEIPHLNLSYFSAPGYDSEELRATIKDAADLLDLSKNRELTFGNFKSITVDLSANMNKVISKTFTKDPKSLEKATQAPEFEKDQKILNLMIEAKKGHFKNEKLILQLAGEMRTNEEFAAVFANLFNTDSTEDFIRLFATLYHNHVQNLIAEDKTPNAFNSSFLNYFEVSVPNKTDGAEHALHGKRRAAIQMFIKQRVSTYETNPAVVGWNFTFIEENASYFLNELGAQLTHKEIITIAIKTAAAGPNPTTMAGLTRGDFYRLLEAAHNTDNVGRLGLLLPLSLFENEFVAEVASELSVTSSALKVISEKYELEAPSEEDEWSSDEEDMLSPTPPYSREGSPDELSDLQESLATQLSALSTQS